MWRVALWFSFAAGCTELTGLNDLEFPGAGGATSAGGSTNSVGGSGGGTVCPEDFGDCDRLPENGCEESLVDNDAHCGACDHACAPSSCVARRCELAELVTMEAAPFSIAAAGGRLFWVNAFDGSIRRCDAANCADTVTSIANSGTTAYFLSVDDTHVFWNRNGADEMWRCPMDGCLGNEQLLASSVNDPTTSTVGGGYVYWASNEGTVRRVAVGGGQPELMAIADGADGWVLLDGVQMYWTTRAKVNRCDVAQCQATKVSIVPDLPNVVGIDVDADSIYVSTVGNVSDEIRRIPKAGGTGIPIATGLSEPWGIIELDDHVYWVERAGNVARAVHKDGGNIVELAAGLGQPWVLAHDAGFIYIADNANSRIVRIDPL